MEIQLVKAVGAGPTLLAAFDKALYNAGIHDFNLLVLSSVIPAATELKQIKRFNQKERIIGNRLYIVLSTISSNKLGEHITAGLGWAQDKKTQAGVFVENHGHTPTEVEAELQATMRSMTKYRKGEYKYDTLKNSIICEKEPVCALVAAIYKQENW